MPRLASLALLAPDPRRGLLGMGRALWLYRRFVVSMVAREFRSRYLGSALGVLWALLTPLATILVYLVIFSAVLGGRLPGMGDPLSYGIFLCTGILVWGFFAETVTRCQTVFVENGNLLKKMSFPRITLPMIVLLTALVNFLLVAAVFFVLLLALGRLPGAAIVAMAPLLAVQQGFAIGLGILLGTLHVFFRDVGQLWTVTLNLWFWVTPIVYKLELLPEWARGLIAWNPLAALFMSYQDLVLESRWPEWTQLAYPAAVGALFLALGLLVFRKLSGEMVDEL